MIWNGTAKVTGLFLALVSCGLAVEIPITRSSATAFDRRGANQNGCFTSGCRPELTLDGNREAQSRWSCNPDRLGVQQCAITYEFDGEYDVSAVCLAFHKGDERVRDFKILDGQTLVSETDSESSSGLYRGLEEFPVDYTGNSVTILHTPPDDDEWFSLIEVIILGQPSGGGSDISVSASGYDNRSNSGCNGPCLPINSIDGNFNTRWSCSRSVSDGTCKIIYTFPSPISLDSIDLYLYKGDERVRRMYVKIDGSTIGTFTSSGDTTGPENYRINRSNVRTLELKARGLGDGWLSISEVEFNE